MVEYDYIIAGAGAAGLSLALQIAEQPALAHKRILLLDKSDKSTNDRTWCFWQQGTGKFDSCLTHQWTQFQFYSPTVATLLDIAPYTYKMLSSERFYKYCFEQISSSPNITFVQDEITALNSDGTVVTKTETYKATYIFNSAKVAIPKLKQKHYLLQHFKGWFVHTEQPCFEPNKPTLMDFRIDQGGDCRFVYVLPTSPYDALVEYTVFSPALLPKEQYDAGLELYMKNTLGITQYTITHSEFGVIPMTNAPIKQRSNSRIINIGTAGGASKASTGYTFNFIQKQTTELVERLCANELRNTPKFIGKKKYKFYDSVFLNVLSQSKLPAWQVFSDLFSKLPTPLVLKFLDEETSFAEDLKVVLNSVDKATFTKAAMKEIIKKIGA